MKILHTSDWHLGATLCGAALLDVQTGVLGGLPDCCEQNDVQAVILSGDVFDHAVVGADAIALYDQIMTELCVKRGIRVLICAGNHDGAARLSSCGALLQKAGLYVAGSIKDGVKTVDLGGVHVHLLPYFSIEEARYIYPEAEIKTYHDAVQTVLEDVRARMTRDGKNILAAHLYVTGAEVSESDRAVMVGGANRVGSEALAGFDYVALGHLHRPQQVSETVRYAGAPVKMSFSEATQEKSFTILDTDTMQVCEAPVSQSPDLRQIKGTRADILAHAPADQSRDNYTKITLEDEYPHIEIQLMLRQWYPNLLALEGKAYEADENKGTLTFNDAGSLTTEEIMADFMLAYTGEKPSERLKQLFLRAQQKAEKEEAQ